MNEVTVAVKVLSGLIDALPAVAEVLGRLFGHDPKTVADRIKAAKAAIKDPIDVRPGDFAREARLQALGDAILRAQGLQPEFVEPGHPDD
jgi:hypothetical protein